MLRKIGTGIVCSALLMAASSAQEVMVPRQAKVVTLQMTSAKPSVDIDLAPSAPKKVRIAKAEVGKIPSTRAVSGKISMQSAKTPKVTPQVAMISRPVQSTVAFASKEPAPVAQPVNLGLVETAFTKLANGFDFPVGKPDAEGYYKARGFRAQGHLGEDWDGVGGGDTDLGDPIFSIGDGIVVFARDVHMGWGNVVIVRHTYRENGAVRTIDALYGHLNSILVKRGQTIARGQQIATMGNAHGQYDAHLHLEIRKNIEIGMSRSAFRKDFSNYYDPSEFIASHRNIAGGGSKYRVAMNTFAQDAAYHFDTARNFSARQRSTAQSAAALKRAVSSSR